MIQQHGEPSDVPSAQDSQRPPARRKWNWPAFVSFLLAVMLWIGEIDSMEMPLRERNFLLAWGVFAVYSTIVLVPYYFARRRWKQAPDEWTGGGYLNAIACILVCNTVWMVCMFGVGLLYGR